MGPRRTLCCCAGKKGVRAQGVIGRHCLAGGRVAACAVKAQTGRTGFADPVEAPMSGYEAHPPELIPILSRGKHRSPRQGACFMELVSFLAGERWSDHPACTHPLLAAVARDVNDYTSNAGRPRLAELIPSVIGLTGEDLHIDARIALVCAQRALPVVAAERQQTMAVSVLACERVLAALDGRPEAGSRSRAGRRWRKLRTRRSGRAASPATTRSRRRPFATAARPPPSAPRWRGSHWRASRSPMRCSLPCSATPSARAPRGPAGTSALTRPATARHGRPPAHSPAQLPRSDSTPRPAALELTGGPPGRPLVATAGVALARSYP